MKEQDLELVGQPFDYVTNTSSSSRLAQALRAMVNTKQKVLQGGVYLVGRYCASIALKAIGVVLITRALGPEQYGVFVVAFGVYQYALSVGQAGLHIYLLRQEGEVSKRTYGTATVLLLALALLTFMGMRVVAAHLDDITKSQGAGYVLELMALAFLPQFVAIPALARLERELQYKSVAILEIAAQAGYYLAAIPLVALGHGPASLAIAFILQNVLIAVLAHAHARCLPTLAWDTVTARRIFVYAGCFCAASWLWDLRGLVNPLIVGHSLGVEAVGLVGFTIGLVEMLTIIKSIVWRLSVVVLGRVQADMGKVRESITQGMLLQSLSIGAVLLGFGWVGHIAVPIIFGERWAPIMTIYPYIAIGYFVNAQFNMHSAALAALRRNGDVGLFHLVHVALLAGVAFVAVPRVGIIGYGWAELAALASYAILWSAVRRRIGSPEYMVAATWFVGVAGGLFWRDLGAWAISLPFLALATPPSVRQLANIHASFRTRRKELTSARA